MPTHVHTAITVEPLDPAVIESAASDERCGAVATFRGIIRNHDGGASVDAIDYTAHPDAPKILREIAQHFSTRPGIHAIEAWHRVGTLSVGECAMVVAVAAEHRGQAFTAVEALVDEIKARLPIWKKQMLSDGSHNWPGLP